MASFGHVVLGAVAAKAYDGELKWKTVVAFSTMSLLPDLDVIGFRFGVAYADPWGHRGATHSVVFALAVALVGLLLTRAPRTAAFLFATVVSHPLLDMLTDGGLGVALAWPFSNERLFFPWTPIPVAPIGRGMLSWRGLYVVAVESVIFLPLLFIPWRRLKVGTEPAPPR